MDYLDPETLNGLNLYAYCGNDPVNRLDPTGYFWDTVFDFLFIGWDIYNLCTNKGYKDWKNWAALAADALFAALPFVPGGGQIIKIGNKVDNVDDVVDLVRGIDNFDDLSKVTFIGRNANRVTDVATAVNKSSDLYQVWKRYDKSAKGIKRFFHNFISVLHDGIWMFVKLRRGYTVIDLGIKTSHRWWGFWYGIERINIAIWKTRSIWKWLYHLEGF